MSQQWGSLEEDTTINRDESNRLPFETRRVNCRVSNLSTLAARRSTGRKGEGEISVAGKKSEEAREESANKGTPFKRQTVASRLNKLADTTRKRLAHRSIRRFESDRWSNIVIPTHLSLSFFPFSSRSFFSLTFRRGVSRPPDFCNYQFSVAEAGRLIVE